MSKRSQSKASPEAAPPPSSIPVRNRTLQRNCSCGAAAGMSGECQKCQINRLTAQHQSMNQIPSSALTAIVDEGVHSPGQPLDPEQRVEMESRLGHNFGDVRVHADAQAAESAEALDATAYTLGKDIVFGPGKYRPQTHEGQALLAHELTHVVQQAGSSGGSTSQLEVSSPNDLSEKEANRNAQSIFQATSEEIAPQSSPQVQREEKRDPIHQGMVEDFRTRHGIPESGLDEFGRRVGPSEGQIKYQLIPAERQAANYAEALKKLQTLDPDIHRYLSGTRLNGGNQLVRGGSAVDNSQTPPVTLQYTFNLEVKTASLAPGQEARFNGGIPILSPGGTTTRTLTANMTMEISPAAAWDPAVLAQALYHEGLHMLIFVQDLLPPATPSRHIGALANYNQTAQANAEYKQAEAELEVYIDLDWKARKVTPKSAPGKAASEILEHMIEEKYVFDQEKAQFGTKVPNSSITRGYIIDGFRDLNVTPNFSDKNLVKIVDRMTRILDDIDAKTSAKKAPATGTQTPAKPAQGTKP